MNVYLKDGVLTVNIEEKDTDVIKLVEERVDHGPEETVRLALRIGARVLRTTSTSVDVDYVEKEFSKIVAQLSTTIADTTKALEAKTQEQLKLTFGDGNGSAGYLPLVLKKHEEELNKILDVRFDKDSKTGVLNLMSQVIQEAIADQRKAIFSEINPDDPNGPIGRLVIKAKTQEEKLLSKLANIEQAVATKKEVDVEKAKGTLKGRSYQETVMSELENIAYHLGDTVLPEWDKSGITGKDGDIVIIVNQKHCGGRSLRLAVEASSMKNKSIADILEDMSSSKINRDAQASIGVYASAPKGIGCFRDYPENRVFCLYNEETGTSTLETAYKYARCLAILEASDHSTDFDSTAIANLLEDAKRQLGCIRTIKASLSKASNGICKAEEQVDELHTELKETLEKISDKIVKNAA